MTRPLARILMAISLFVGLVQYGWAAPLTEKQVGQFIETLPQLQKIGEQHPETNQQAMINPTKPLSSSIEKIPSSEPAYKALTAMTEKNGYSTLTQWAEIGDRVLQAYMLISMEVSAGQLKQIQQQAQMALKSGMLPPEISAALEQSMGAEPLGQLGLSPNAEQDVPAVLPYRKQLDQLLDSN